MAIFSALVVLSALLGTFASPVDTSKRSTAEDFLFRRYDTSSNDLVRRQNYNQDYVAGGDVIFTPSGTGTFEVQWSAPSTSDDFVVGRGWTTGSRK